MGHKKRVLDFDIAKALEANPTDTDAVLCRKIGCGGRRVQEVREYLGLPERPVRQPYNTSAARVVRAARLAKSPSPEAAAELALIRAELDRVRSELARQTGPTDAQERLSSPPSATPHEIPVLPATPPSDASQTPVLQGCRVTWLHETVGTPDPNRPTLFHEERRGER